MVKRAIKRATGEIFAVKIINKEKMNEEELIGLQNEVEILTQLDHPNIVKLFEIFEDDDFFYMVMEMLTGGEVIHQ